MQNGKSAWRIIIPVQPAAPKQYGAEEMQRMTEKISGVKLRIEKSDAVPVANTIIIKFPKTSPVVKTKSAELKLQKDVVENIAVYVTGGNFYLADNNSRGALYTVYYFLQNAMGVRWCWPWNDGEFFAVQKTYVVPALKWNYKPQLQFCEMTPCYEESHEYTQIWLARNFLNGSPHTSSIRDKGVFFRHDGQH